jgi:hypothetical protein
MERELKRQNKAGYTVEAARGLGGSPITTVSSTQLVTDQLPPANSPSETNMNL